MGLVKIEIPANIQHTVEMLRKTGERWGTSQVVRLAAAIAYYAASSLLSLLAVIVLVGSLVFFGEDNIRAEIVQGLQVIIGAGNAQVIDDALKNTSEDIRESSPVASIGIVLVLVYSSSRMFRRLRDALNVLWDVSPKTQNENYVKSYLRDTFVSVLSAVVFGILLLLLLLLNGVAFAVVDTLHRFVPESSFIQVWQIASYGLSLVAMSLIFTLVYRFLPDTRLAWRTVSVGGLLTALLFTVGQFVIAGYIDLTNTGTVFGVVGSFVVILLWVYVCAYIVLFGAIFTNVYDQEVTEHRSDFDGAR